MCPLSSAAVLPSSFKARPGAYAYADTWSYTATVASTQLGQRPSTALYRSQLPSMPSPASAEKSQQPDLLAMVEEQQQQQQQQQCAMREAASAVHAANVEAAMSKAAGRPGSAKSGSKSKTETEKLSIVDANITTYQLAFHLAQVGPVRSNSLLAHAISQCPTFLNLHFLLCLFCSYIPRFILQPSTAQSAGAHHLTIAQCQTGATRSRRECRCRRGCSK